MVLTSNIGAMHCMLSQVPICCHMKSHSVMDHFPLYLTQFPKLFSGVIYKFSVGKISINTQKQWCKLLLHKTLVRLSSPLSLPKINNVIKTEILCCESRKLIQETIKGLFSLSTSMFNVSC